MEIIDQLGVALGLASLAGLNLYLTVFVSGLAIRMGWVDLSANYEHLAVLGNPWVLGVAGVMFLVEFLADKIPWLDSAWDVVHTVVRPAGGVMLALGALGTQDPAVSVIAGLIAGGATLATHGTKAGSRLLINASPEPVSNSVASLAEDGLVLGGLGLIAASPLVALVVFTIFVIACVVLITWLGKRLKRLGKAAWAKLPFFGRKGERLA